MTYACCICKIKHVGNGCMLPCCSAYVCQHAFAERMNSSRYFISTGVTCPECSVRLPSLVSINATKQIVPLSFVSRASFRMLLAVGQLASYAISPGLTLGCIALTMYLILNAFGVCVASSMFSSGYCFTALSFLHEFVVAQQSLKESGFFPLAHPVFVWGFFILVSAFISLFLLVCGGELCRRLGANFRTFVQKHASVYYNPYTLI